MSIINELDALPCSLIITDVYGKIVMLNALAKTEFLAEPSVSPEFIDKLFPPASRIFLQTHLWPMLRKEGQIKEYYLKILSKDNTPLSVLVNVSLGTFADSPCYRWVLLPALQRASFEQELLKARQQSQHYAQEVSIAKRRLRNILDAAEDIAIMTLDNLGQIQFANVGAIKLLGFAETKLINQQFARFIKCEGLAQAGKIRLQQQLQKLSDALIPGDYLAEFETQLQHVSGKSIDVLLQLRPLIGEAQSAPKQLLLLATDISKRKQLERLQNEFVATISHEFRTPLTSILGSLTLLAQRYAGNFSDKAQKLLDVSINSSYRLKHLVNDLLDFGKINSGNLRVTLEVCALKPLLENMILEHQYFLKSKQVKLTLCMPEAPIAVQTDPQRFNQIMANLLSNAIKFSPNGSEVIIAVKEQETNLIITVEDRGSGVQPVFLDRLFTQFSQEDSASNREFEGSGLGLAISKGLVNAMGGEIGYRSATPHGAIFWFSCLKA